MQTKEFKKIFNEIACLHHFHADFGGWYKHSDNCLLALELQKSSYSPFYYLNIKIYIDGAFGRSCLPSKELVLDHNGNFSTRQPRQFRDVFDLEVPMGKNQREQLLEAFFTQFLDPFSEQALSISGIQKLLEKKELCLMKSVQKELVRLGYPFGNLQAI